VLLDNESLLLPLRLNSLWLYLPEGARDDEPVGLSDRSLSGSRKSLTPGSPSLSDCTLQQLCHLGKQHLVMSEKLWQEALVRSSLEASFQVPFHSYQLLI